MGSSPSKETVRNNNSTNSPKRKSKQSPHIQQVRSGNSGYTRDDGTTSMKSRSSPRKERRSRQHERKEETPPVSSSSSLSPSQNSGTASPEKMALSNTATSENSGIVGPYSKDQAHSALSSSYIADEQVKVNLAMADLMAYLQIVANNSSNLPLTRRDDPEVHKSVSNLTSEEYARKSAAFIPADVRVIAGSFTKYGNVWDLPTTEEFNAVDGAHEPGRSYGGACANAMLKVLYDAANEAMDASIEDHMDGSALFDDDETCCSGPLELSRDRTFQSLVLGDVGTQTSITWAQLLRKMKAEIREIEYAQAPTISTSRKFDLNTPFTLIPDDFDEGRGQRRSLLIGCNYSNIHGAELKASHDDIRSMKDYIINVHGFPEKKGLMTVLMDDAEHKHPTHMNITEALKALSEQSQPGDAVFVHFSGHGGRVLDEESYDEVIVPTDFQTAGLVRDTLIFKTLLAPMRFGVTVTILLDTCDTGMMLDLPYAWQSKTDRIENVAKLSQNNDFSFVRFLKVIKTLYEASTFTQLGKTVRTALNDADSEDDEDETDCDSQTQDYTVNKKDDSSRTSNQNLLNNPLYAALTACSAPVADVIEKKNGQPVTSPSKQNLVEKIMNCTLGDELLSEDEDTYAGNLGDNTFETDGDGSVSAMEHRRRR
mmetsp:Transcript_5122/g.7413  ORF Transcript_5122/g.7413 Transcript_5122/m.7413 type:complete len:654 (-) Transcript_5122:156-2117(-)